MTPKHRPIYQEDIDHLLKFTSMVSYLLEHVAEGGYSHAEKRGILLLTKTIVDDELNRQVSFYTVRSEIEIAKIVPHDPNDIDVSSIPF